jgi:hypothetical protein
MAQCRDLLVITLGVLISADLGVLTLALLHELLQDRIIAGTTARGELGKNG